MDELNVLIEDAGNSGDNTPELFFGTLNNWSIQNGASFTIDGSGGETTKRYKIIPCTCSWEPDGLWAGVSCPRWQRMEWLWEPLRLCWAC